MSRIHTKRLLVLALVATLVAPAARGDGDDPLEALARDLVAKRAAVEKLSTELELKKAAERDALRSLSQQKADVERKVKALEHEREELDRALAERDAATAAREGARRALEPLVRRHLGLLLAYVRAALPFKTTERAQALEELERELTAGRVTPDQALGRLWSAVDDELRLTRDSGLYRQQLELDGQAQLVDVAKLGMVLLYVRTMDGRFGYVLPEGDAWRVVVVTDPAPRALIEALFASLDKHLRQGFFTLPNPYAGQTPGEK